MILPVVWVTLIVGVCQVTLGIHHEVVGATLCGCVVVSLGTFVILLNTKG